MSRNMGMLPVFLDDALWSSSSSWPTCPGFWESKNDLKLFSHKNHHLKLLYKIYFFWFMFYIRSLIFPPWSQTKTSKFFQKSFPGTWACSPKDMGIYPRFLDIVPRSVKCTYCGCWMTDVAKLSSSWQVQYQSNWELRLVLISVWHPPGPPHPSGQVYFSHF